MEQAEFMEPNSVNSLIDYVIENEIPENILYSPRKSGYIWVDLQCMLKAWKILLLTATPIVNSFSDMTNIFKILLKDNDISQIKTLDDVADYLSEVGVSYDVEKV